MKIKGVLTGKIKEILFAEGITKENPCTEERLKIKVGTSRGSIREALNELEKEGLIERKQRKGFYLRKPTVDELSAIYDLRSVLEGFAGRLAAEKASNNDFEELNNIARQCETWLAKKNLKKADKADLAFHRKIAELSGNSYLLEIMDNFAILEKAFAMSYQFSSAPPDKAFPYPHDAIMKTLKNRDAEKCERIIRSHVQACKQRLIENILGLRLKHF
jgi:DNA-binding GntR family transcriptional regulator